MEEAQAWQKAQVENTIWAYSEFITQFSDSPFVEEAKLRIKHLQEQNQVKEYFSKTEETSGKLKISKVKDPLSGEYIFEVHNQRNEKVPIPYEILNSSERLYLAKDKSTQKFGFLDKNLITIIPFDYTQAEIFKQGIAKVTKAGAEFFIDKHNQKSNPYEVQETEILIEEKPPSATIPGRKKLNLEKSQEGKGESNQYTPSPPTPQKPVQQTKKKSSIPLFLGGILGALALAAIAFFIFQYIFKEVGSSSESDNGNDEYYAIDKELIPFRKGKKWGYANRAMEMIIAVEYDFTYPFKQGRGLVRKDGLYGFVDEKGELVIPLKYDDAYSFAEGIALVQKDDFWGAIDREGEQAIDFQFVEVDSEGFSEGLLAVSQNEKWGFINPESEIVIDYVFDEFYGFSEGLAAVEQSGHWGFIDKKGKIIVPLDYDDAFYFSEGIAPVKRKTSWLLINEEGSVQEILDFEELCSFSEGLAAAKQNGKWGFIDKNGKTVIDFQYQSADKQGFREGLAAVKKDGKWGFIDKNNKEIIAFEYENTDNFKKNEVTAVRLGENLWGYIDKRGIKYFED